MKVLFFRVPDEMAEAVEDLAKREMRSLNMQGQILLGYALNHYDEVSIKLPAPRGEAAADTSTGKTEKQPEALKKNARLAKPKNKSVAKLGIEPVDSCPHGYAKGMCKKVDCNRKYAK